MVSTKNLQLDLIQLRTRILNRIERVADCSFADLMEDRNINGLIRSDKDFSGKVRFEPRIIRQLRQFAIQKCHICQFEVIRMRSDFTDEPALRIQQPCPYTLRIDEIPMTFVGKGVQTRPDRVHEHRRQNEEALRVLSASLCDFIQILSKCFSKKFIISLF